MVENVKINGLVSGIVAGCYWTMWFHVNNNNGIQEDLTKQESGLKCNHEWMESNGDIAKKGDGWVQLNMSVIDPLR